MKNDSASQTTQSKPDSVPGEDWEQRLVRRFGIANPQPVPSRIATCPECGGHLHWQMTTTDGLNDMSLDCDNEPDIDDEEEAEMHRGWQSDWQPVIDRVKAWIHSANTELRNGPGSGESPQNKETN